MYVYFNNEGVLKTTIPHGEPVRQGSNLNLYICLEPDFFTSKNENIEDWTVNVDLILPNERIGTTKLLTTKVNNIPETIIFQKTNDSEVTYNLKNGKDYLCYEFSFTPETSTVYAGTLIAAISLIKIDMVDGVVISKDTKYFGNAIIFVEKTFGYGKRIVDESSLHYQNLVDQINDLNIKKATKEELKEGLEKKEDKANKTDDINVNTNEASSIKYPSEKGLAKALELKEDIQHKVDKITTNNPSTTLYPSEKAVFDALETLKTNIDEQISGCEVISNKIGAIDETRSSDRKYTSEVAVIDYVNLKLDNLDGIVENLVKGKEDVSNKKQQINVENPSETYYPSEKAVALQIKDINGKFVPLLRKIANITLENDITIEELASALQLGTASKKDIGTNQDEVPVIGTDGKLPLSIIPIGTGLFYGGTLELIRDNTWLSPTADFSNVFGLVPGAEIKIEVTDDYSPAYFICSQSGTFLGLECTVGDWIVCNGANNYVRIDNVDAVISVNGLTGVINLNTKNILVGNYTKGNSDADIADGDTINEAFSKTINKIKVNVITMPNSYENITINEFGNIINSIKSNSINILHYQTSNSYIDYVIYDYSISEKYLIFLDVQATTVKIIEIEISEETADLAVTINEISGKITTFSVNGIDVPITNKNIDLKTDKVSILYNNEKGLHLPDSWVDYLKEQTFAIPVLTLEKNANNTYEYGITIQNLAFNHKETNIDNINGTLTLKENNVIIKENIEKSNELIEIDFTKNITMTQNYTYTLSCVDTLGNTRQVSTSITQYKPVYYGLNTSTTITTITGLTKINSSIFGEITVNPTSDGNYVYFVTNGTIKNITSSGFDVPYILQESKVTVNLNGSNVQYNVYRTSSAIKSGESTFKIVQ
nr:MAG TPA: hypothetical protein [Caudoviricetes sp.]